MPSNVTKAMKEYSTGLKVKEKRFKKCPAKSPDKRPAKVFCKIFYGTDFTPLVTHCLNQHDCETNEKIAVTN